MRKDQSEQEIDFKKRARRRLVGAIALVILMIVILPMVLKDRAIPEYQEEVEITLGNQLATNDEIDPTFDSNVVPDEAVTTTNETVVDLPVAPAVEVKEEKVAEVKVESKPTPAEKETVDKQETPPAKPAKAKPAPEKPVEVKKEAVKPVATGGSKYFVQVGVFSDPSNVKKLQTQLNALGYQSLTEVAKTAKGDKTRLRTQSFENRNEAAIALENIKDAGVTGMIVREK